MVPTGRTGGLEGTDRRSVTGRRIPPAPLAKTLCVLGLGVLLRKTPYSERLGIRTGAPADQVGGKGTRDGADRRSVTGRRIPPADVIME
jgi:hypothetical protein